MKIKDALFRLNDFCIANDIEYMVTGTLALTMLGIPASPQDIDIKVFNLNEEQNAKLKELEKLSGLENANYSDHGCYTFMVKGYKVNAIISEQICNTEISQVPVVCQANDTHKCGIINVQPVIGALTDKMSLKRHKDKDFMLDLIKTLSSL